MQIVHYGTIDLQPVLSVPLSGTLCSLYEMSGEGVSCSLPGKDSMQTDKILISGLEFYAYHGASDQEQTVGHRYQVDARLEVDTRPAGLSDRLSDTVSYSRVAKRLMEVGTQEQFRLLEALAARMTQAVLADFPSIECIVLKVQKMVPPMNAIVASVGVEIVRSRSAEG